MFLNFIKDYFLKRILKNNLHNTKSNSSLEKINTVGLLVDESCFSETEALIQELVAGGILEHQIKIIVYKDKMRKNEVHSQPTFSMKHLNWKAEIINPIVSDFISEKFDLLISYYAIEKAILLKITSNSKAQFKVGFSTVDKRLNDLMINTNAENAPVFIHELFKYLKILKKI